MAAAAVRVLVAVGVHDEMCVEEKGVDSFVGMGECRESWYVGQGREGAFVYDWA